MSEAIELAHGAARARIALRGAELRAWSAHGRALLWQPDAAIWDAVSPILFPVVGWCADAVARVDGCAYPMGVHGFAAQSDFVCIARGRDHARFALADDETTQARYPFAFRFEVSYRLGEDWLEIALQAHNAGARAMPYACGLHPGFRWPFAGGDAGDYRLVLDAPQRPSVPVIAPGGLFSPERRALDFDGVTLALSHDLLAREALCFLDAHCSQIVFERPGHGSLSMSVEGFPHLAVWSRAGAPFLCLEAWTGHGDPVGFSGDLFAKPSMIVLAPGETRAHSARFMLNV